jgi:hypothetical protein
MFLKMKAGSLRIGIVAGAASFLRTVAPAPVKHFDAVQASSVIKGTVSREGDLR